MRALVVYESMFGNTEQVAKAVAGGLAEGMDVEVCEVSKAPAPVAEPVDLVVVGGPTHAFSLSRPSTRADALRQGARQGTQEVGLREWIGGLPRGPHPQVVAAFDTRAGTVRHLPGSAAHKAVRLLHAHGYDSAGCQSFYVKDVAGPLLDGELTRAHAWGRTLANGLSHRSHGRAVADPATEREEPMLHPTKRPTYDASHDPAPWSPSRVVVGVDGSADDEPALDWAVQESRSHRCPLVLVTSGWGDLPVSAPRTANLEREHRQRLAHDLLDDIRDRIAHEAPDVRTQVADGEPSRALVHLAGERDLVVVGRRSQHPFLHTLLGSTSTATAGRSAGPIVVVPGNWDATRHRADPVVVGIQPGTDESVLALAVARASDHRVGLVVVSAFDPPVGTFNAHDLDHLRAGTQCHLDDRLRPWRTAHPTLPVRTSCDPLTPAEALLGVGRAQLLVVGRHTGRHHVGGLAIGSTTRRVLRHAQCPVLVAPCSLVDPVEGLSTDFDEGDTPEF